MKKYIFTLILLVSFVVHKQKVYSQTINEIFISMPAELLPGISEGNKTMLTVDTSKTAIPYIFGEIQKVNHGSSYLNIKTSDVGNTQIKLLPVAGDSSIVSVIQTVCGGAETDICNSIITFYTIDWKELDNELFLPSLSPEMFMDSSKKYIDNYKYALSLPDIYPISAKYDETSTDLTLLFHYKDRLDNMHLKEFESFLKSDSVILQWDESGFK
ncbi:MAG: DUF3256 family protein [Fermentimonas sp.]|nr:DUF3256 family protein [Fermentimonas sp.]